MKIPEPLHTILGKYYHVETYDPQLIHRAISSGVGFPYDVSLFKSQLESAIETKSISLENFELLTGLDFDSEAELTEHLKNILSELP